MKKVITILLLSAVVAAILTGCSTNVGQTSEYFVVAPAVSATVSLQEHYQVTEEPQESESLNEDGVYSSKEDVSLFIHLYGKLPSNYITKEQAQQLGWNGGSLDQFAPGKCIGGNYFGNYEGLLPSAAGRIYSECDIDTLGAPSRGAKRIVFSNDGLIYFTDDHYESFTLLYGDDNA